MAGIKGRTIGGLVLLPLLVVGGCGRSVPGPYTPEVAGVVASTEWVELNVVSRFVLEDGTFVDARILDKTETTIVYQAGRTIGDLLLAGSTADGQWLAFVAPAGRDDLPDDCYAVDGYATDEGDWIQTDIGLRLRKAPDFDPGLLPDVPGDYTPTSHPGLRYDAVGQTLCVNRDGLVTLRDW